MYQKYECISLRSEWKSREMVENEQAQSCSGNISSCSEYKLHVSRCENRRYVSCRKKRFVVLQPK